MLRTDRKRFVSIQNFDFKTFPFDLFWNESSKTEASDLERSLIWHCYSRIRIRDSAFWNHGSGSERIFTDPKHCKAGYGTGSAFLTVCQCAQNINSQNCTVPVTLYLYSIFITYLQILWPFQRKVRKLEDKEEGGRGQCECWSSQEVTKAITKGLLIPADGHWKTRQL